MLSATDAAIVKGLLAQGHKQHDIAAHFGENGGRIADIHTGKKFSEVKAAPPEMLPAIPKSQPRFVDPKAPLEQQIESLQTLIRDPPENGRWITFSPKLADWVNTNLNNNNRRKRVNNIKRFSEAMTSGEWMPTGDTIKFSRDHVLIDGQNRLAACVKAGKPFKTLVVFGIDPLAILRVDINAVRTNADTMEIEGVPRSRIVASAVRWIIVGQDRGRQIQNTELHDYYREHIDHDDMQLAVRRAVASGRILPPGSLAALLYQFENKSKRTMESFASDLAKHKRGAHKLMQQVDRLRKQNMGRMHENQLQAMIILAWNAYRNNETITADMLRWTENKEFPTIA